MKESLVINMDTGKLKRLGRARIWKRTAENLAREQIRKCFYKKNGVPSTHAYSIYAKCSPVVTWL
jgi:hypothetical protein